MKLIRKGKQLNLIFWSHVCLMMTEITKEQIFHRLYPSFNLFTSNVLVANDKLWSKTNLSLLWIKLLKNEHSFRMFIWNLNSIIFHQNHHKTVKNIQHSHTSVYVECQNSYIYTWHYYSIWGFQFLLQAKIWMDFYKKFRKLQLFEINTIKTKAWCPPQKSRKPINQYTINTRI